MWTPRLAKTIRSPNSRSWICLIASDAAPEERAKPPRPMAVVRPLCEKPIAGGAVMRGRRRHDQRQFRDKAQSGRADRRYRTAPARRLAIHGASDRLGVRRGPATEARGYTRKPRPRCAVRSRFRLDPASRRRRSPGEAVLPLVIPGRGRRPSAGYLISAMISRKLGCSAEPAIRTKTISVVTISAPCFARRNRGLLAFRAPRADSIAHQMDAPFGIEQPERGLHDADVRLAAGDDDVAPTFQPVEKTRRAAGIERDLCASRPSQSPPARRWSDQAGRHCAR